MRRIVVDAALMKQAVNQVLGRATVITFHVDWPELQLNESQMMANVLARCDGREVPYPEPYVTVELERPSHA